MPLALVSAARSDTGRVRADNQDAGLASSRVAAVADGVGGLRGGAVAAALVVTRLAELSARSAEDVPERADGRAEDVALEELREALTGAQDALEGVAAAQPALAGLSTTLTALVASGQDLLLAHVGDSRCYRLVDGHLEQVSRDHTYVQHLVDAGVITAVQAELHPHRHLIVRSLGDGQASHTVDLARLAAAAGQRWLLCSDGLSGVVGPAALSAVLDSPLAPAECAEALVALALRAGAPDNVTAVVVDVVEVAAQPGAQGAPDERQTAAVDLVGAASSGLRAA